MHGCTRIAAECSGRRAADEGMQNVETELERLLNEYDFSEWQQYFDETKQTVGNITEYGDVKTLIEKAASNVIEADEPTSILLIVKDIFVPHRETAAAFSSFPRTHPLLQFRTILSEYRGQRCRPCGQVQISGSAQKLMNPMLVFLINGIVYVIEKIVLPMLLAAGVLTIVDGLSDKLKVGRTVKLLHKSVKWLLGLLTTVYIAVTVVGGMTAGAADGISVRTAKYAIDPTVPAAGGMVTGAADAVLGSSALLKNSVGTVAIILAAAVIAKPMLTVAGGMFALRITSAICEPFSDERIPKMLDGIAETVSYLFAAVAAVTGMFVISLVVMLLTGNALAV